MAKRYRDGEHASSSSSDALPGHVCDDNTPAPAGTSISSHGDGPRTIRDCFRWPEFLLGVVTAFGGMDVLMENLEPGICTSSVFSGMECHNVALNCLVAAVQKRYGDRLMEQLVVNWSACDSSEKCRQLLRNAKVQFRPKHIFTNVQDRLAIELQGFFDSEFERHMQEYTMLTFNGETHSNAAKCLGRKLADVLFDKAATVGLLRRGLCYMHGPGDCECEVRPPPTSGQQEFHFGGIPCDSFSTRGSMFDLLHDTCKSLTVMLADLVEQETDFGIYECTPRFPVEIILNNALIMSIYFVSHMIMCPSHYGLPSNRKRVILVVINKKRRVILHSFTSFAARCRRRVVATGSIFWCSPPQELMEYKQVLAKKRMVSPNLPWSHTLTPPEAMRMTTVRDKAINKFGSLGGIVTLLEQNGGFESTGPRLPCLTQQCVPFSYDEDRILSPLEALAVQGLPVFPLLEAACGIKCPYDFSACSSADMWSFAGNGQSTIVMGVAIAWCLACTKPRPPSGVSPQICCQAVHDQDDDDNVDCL